MTYLCDLWPQNIMAPGQYRHLLSKFGYKQMQGWKVINCYKSLAGKPSHLTSYLLMWPLTPEYHGGQHRASTNQVFFFYKQMEGWQVINRSRVLQVNLHMWPHMTFDQLMWPLTPEYHGGQHRASTNQVWLHTDAGLESYKPLYGQFQANVNQMAKISNLHLNFDFILIL